MASQNRHLIISRILCLSSSINKGCSSAILVRLVLTETPAATSLSLLIVVDSLLIANGIEETDWMSITALASSV